MATTTTTTTTVSLRDSVRELIQNFVSHQEASGTHVAADILRVVQEESQLLYETQTIRDLFDQDPFEFYNNNNKIKHVIQTFKDHLQVRSCHRLERADDYCLNEAVVQCCCTGGSSTGSGGPDNNNSNKNTPSPKSKKQKRHRHHPPSENNAVTNNNIYSSRIIQLHFRYERDPATSSSTTATSIWYSIDMSIGYGPKQNILTIRVWADGNTPSQLPAISIDAADGGDGDDDDWEDIDSDNDNESDSEMESEDPKKKTKGAQKSDETSKDSAKRSEVTSTKDNDNANDNSKADAEEQSRDRYGCYVDPDVLTSFQTSTGLTDLDEAAAFFTLMTFPFYQHEFDLVGFVLDSVFGHENDDDDDDKE